MVGTPAPSQGSRPLGRPGEAGTELDAGLGGGVVKSWGGGTKNSTKKQLLGKCAPVG